MCEGAWIDGSRPAPPKPSHEEQERAHEIQVGERIEGHASLPVGGRVAELKGRPGVGELVDGDRGDDAWNKSQIVGDRL